MNEQRKKYVIDFFSVKHVYISENGFLGRMSLSAW